MLDLEELLNTKVEPSVTPFRVNLEPVILSIKLYPELKNNMIRYV